MADRPAEQRQELVWQGLIDGLDDEGQARVEYVFTRTPEEAEEYRDAVQSDG